MELIQGKDGIELVHSMGNWKLKKEIGFSPVEALVASIAACGTYVYQSILKKSEIGYVLLDVRVTYERSQELKAQPLKSVQIEFKMKIAEDNQERAIRALELINRNCPVVQSLNDGVKVCEKLIFA